jgi:glycogen synthase
MKVLMLGWEYPPHISGGLGTACEGLTTALARCGVQIDFVMPRISGDEQALHMNLYDSVDGLYEQKNPDSRKRSSQRLNTSKLSAEGVRQHLVPSLLSPYLTAQTYQDALVNYSKKILSGKLSEVPEEVRQMILQQGDRSEVGMHYGNNIFEEVARFASHVTQLMSNTDFDIIHAHDWMTFPAGVMLSQICKKPLVVHVHSLEYDRSGEHMNTQIHEIENYGISLASSVIAVSYYTATLVKQYHSAPSHKVNVVHNGVYPRNVIQNYRRLQGWFSKVVLFLGRITFQKGPDYFVEAAAKVIPHVPDVLFIMAGAGDMLNRMVDRVHQLGISRNFYFPGFLRGEDLEEVFSVADLYVMPSVSEPFGITALEAINYDTPVILSKQSGVSEVLHHALKVDFWDVNRMADLIINGLLHEELRSDMLTMAREEVRRLRWDASALKTLEVYRSVLH